MAKTLRLTGALPCLLTLLLSSLRPLRAEDAREKMAVLVFGSSPNDGQLADNITEIVIASVAQRAQTELVGTAEFRKALALDSDRVAQRCLMDVSCVGRVAVSLGVRRMLIGTVAQKKNQFLYTMTLNNIQTDRVENRVFRLVEGSVDQLIASVEEAASEIFRPQIEPSALRVTSDLQGSRVTVDEARVGLAPALAANLVPGRHQVTVEASGRFPWSSEVELLPGQTLDVRLAEANMPERKSWPRYAAFGTGGAAALALVAATGLGFVAQLEPDAVSREDAQRQFDQRRKLGFAADVSLATGGVLAVTSAILFWKYAPHIFETSPSR